MTIAMLCAAPAVAQSMESSADTLHIGYCNGQAGMATSLSSSGKGYVEAAVRLPHEALTAYRGNSIVAVRAALAERINTDTLRVWVRSQLNGENLAQGYVLRQGAGGIVKGWNCVNLDHPLAVSDVAGDIYVGYSLHHKATVKPVAAVAQPIDNTSFVKLNRQEWQDYSEKGTVCVEALVAGDNMPAFDLGLGAATVVPNPSAGKTAVKCEARVHNYGTKPVCGFTLELAAGNVGAQQVHIASGIEPLADTLVTFVSDMGNYTDSDTPWTLRIVSLDGGSDENPDNDAVVPTYKFVRNVLVEEFTTEKCVNCPRVAGYLHLLLDNDEFKGRVVALARHAGFYTDWLTQPCDEELTWLYNSGSSIYAPAMSFNRRPYFVATNGNPTSVTNPSSLDMVEAACREEMGQSANMMMDMTLELNSDSTRVDVAVSGVCTPLYKTQNPRICLYLVENEVKAHAQQGADGVYMQQHVNRAYNSIWGDSVKWNGRSFEYTYSFGIDPSWLKDNMEVVAFVGNYNAEDPTDCVVDNAASTPLLGHDGSETAVGGVRASQTGSSVVCEYSVDGRRIVHCGASHGVRIMRMADGSVRKVVR